MMKIATRQDDLVTLKIFLPTPYLILIHPILIGRKCLHSCIDTLVPLIFGKWLVWLSERSSKRFWASPSVFHTLVIMIDALKLHSTPYYAF